MHPQYIKGLSDGIGFVLRFQKIMRPIIFKTSVIYFRLVSKLGLLFLLLLIIPTTVQANDFDLALCKELHGNQYKSVYIPTMDGRVVKSCVHKKENVSGIVALPGDYGVAGFCEMYEKSDYVCDTNQRNEYVQQIKVNIARLEKQLEAEKKKLNSKD
jgi:hypothetical protein